MATTGTRCLVVWTTVATGGRAEAWAVLDIACEVVDEFPTERSSDEMAADCSSIRETRDGDAGRDEGLAVEYSLKTIRFLGGRLRLLVLLLASPTAL